jgi:flagellin
MNAQQAQRNVKCKTRKTGKSMEKLSSGLRIVRASDDSAGLSISEKIRAQVRGLQQASRNAQDGISLIQTAEGGMNEIHECIQRIREISVQCANDTNNEEDREAMSLEVEQLMDEINEIAGEPGPGTKFNGISLLNDTMGEIKFQIGANRDEDMTIKIEDMTEWGLELGSDRPIFGSPIDYNKICTAIKNSDKDIEKVSKERSSLGAIQNALEHAINNLNNAAENNQAAESRIRDVDMAKEMMNLTKDNILNQASQAMLVQANQFPKVVLDLLK